MDITSPFIPTVQSKMKRLHVLLLVKILRTVLDYLTIVLFLPLKQKAIDIALYHIRVQPEKQFIIYSDSLSVLRSLKNLFRP